PGKTGAEPTPRAEPLLSRTARRGRPTVSLNRGQQAIRALLHAVQVFTAYFLMLVAMVSVFTTGTTPPLAETPFVDGSPGFLHLPHPHAWGAEPRNPGLKRFRRARLERIEFLPTFNGFLVFSVIAGAGVGFFLFRKEGVTGPSGPGSGREMAERLPVRVYLRGAVVHSNPDFERHRSVLGLVHRP
ncbi:MAG: hypothetical protein BJ554DRAFT_6152, partial [Olpidium bornovanus]